MKWKLHPNAQKVEEKLEKTTIFEARESGGAYFITTKGKAGTVPGRDHLGMIDYFADELGIEPSSEFLVIHALDEFLEKTEMIRIRFDSDTADLTIRTIPNQNQIKSLEDLQSIVSDIKYHFKFKNILYTNETKSFENFLADVKQIEKEDENET